MFGEISILLLAFLLYVTGMFLAINGKHGWPQTITKTLGTVVLGVGVLLFGNLSTEILAYYATAMFICAVGDGTLSFQNKQDLNKDFKFLLFAVGLGSFLVGYLGYAILGAVISGLSFIGILPLLIYSGLSLFMFKVLFDKSKMEGIMKPAVMAYLVVSILAGTSGVLVLNSFGGLLGILYFVATALIFISDSLIGLKMFWKQFNSELAVFSTYLVAQMLIASFLMFV